MLFGPWHQNILTTSFQEFVSQCDVTTVNCPLHEGTFGLINKDLLKHFKPVRGLRLVGISKARPLT